MNKCILNGFPITEGECKYLINIYVTKPSTGRYYLKLRRQVGINTISLYSDTATSKGSNIGPFNSIIEAVMCALDMIREDYVVYMTTKAFNEYDETGIR